MIIGIKTVVSLNNVDEANIIFYLQIMLLTDLSYITTE